MTEYDDFQTVLRSAYQNDPCTRKLFEAFRERQAMVEQAGIPLADDPEMVQLHRHLVAAAYAHSCGRPLQINQFVTAMH